MKKTYIQPTTKIHAIRPHSMLAVSPGFEETSGNGADEASKEDFEDINFGW